MFQIVEAGVAAGETDDFMNEEMQFPGKPLQEGELRGLGADFEFPFALGGRQVVGGLDNQAHLIKGHPGDFGPERLVEIEVDFPVSVVPHEQKKLLVKFGVLLCEDSAFPECLVSGLRAEPISEERITVDDLGELIELLVDGAGFGFTKGEETIHEGGDFVGAEEFVQEELKEFIEHALCHGNGNVRQEILRSVGIDLFDKIPEPCDRFGLDGFSHKLAKADEVIVEITRPMDGKVLNPTIFLPEFWDQRGEIFRGLEVKRESAGVNVHSVLVAVDVVSVLAEPLSRKGRKAHHAEGVVHRPVKSMVDKIPGQRGDDIGESLCRFSARPARRDGGDGA